MSVTIDLTDSHVFTATRAFLLIVFPTGVEVIKSQVNRTPPPLAADYAAMNSIVRSRLATNVETWDTTNSNPASFTAMSPFMASLQLDVHGPNAADNSQIVTTLFRSSFATSFFANPPASAPTWPPSIAPLYADEAKQIPFTDGEQQVEDRWVIDLKFQIDPVVTVSQQFAAALAIGLIDVDASYPPGG